MNESIWFLWTLRYVNAVIADKSGGKLVRRLTAKLKNRKFFKSVIEFGIVPVKSMPWITNSVNEVATPILFEKWNKNQTILNKFEKWSKIKYILSKNPPVKETFLNILFFLWKK